MITISDIASDMITQVLKDEQKEGWGLRLYLEPGGCSPSMGLDIVENPKDGDTTVEHNGAKVFIDKDVMSSIKGMTLDFVNTGEQQGFALTGGEASSCGPGCSSCDHS